ncbi:hypothetical protein OB905_13145 [Halobacteria archaeon AArc-dxtr1]|nr:hypothetical protein [Halobacteria archaeon AArc-dxtr1]
MALMPDVLKDSAREGWELGSEDGLSGISKAAGLADGAFTLLFVLIILAVAALVGGEFLEAIPSDGAFGDSIDTLEDNAATSFTLFAVGLLIIPAAAVVGYLWTQMGGMMNGGLQRMGR